MKWTYFWGITYLANVRKPLKIVNVMLCLHNNVALSTMSCMVINHIHFDGGKNMVLDLLIQGF